MSQTREPQTLDDIVNALTHENNRADPVDTVMTEIQYDALFNKAKTIASEQDKPFTLEHRDTNAYQEKLNAFLRKASDSYYRSSYSIISDIIYDRLFDDLVYVESKTGIVMDDSVTSNVGAKPVPTLESVVHDPKMLSLDKTKDRDKLATWLGDREGYLSWKMDGLTIVATYDNGKMTRVVTRGDGEIGEDITHNAIFFHGLPKSIDCKDHMIVRCEAVMYYDDLERINATRKEGPSTSARNLCSGTVCARNPQLAKTRPVYAYAFTLVSGPTSGHYDTDMDKLDSLGFKTVERVPVTKDTVVAAVAQFENKIEANPFPSDGLVLRFNDDVYAASLGSTAHHPRGAIAFKWKDAIEETTLRSIKWSPSATGRLTPVAIFDTAYLGNTNVQRASVHNCSILEKLQLMPGDQIGVYKANMIIPQISENFTPHPDYQLPTITCPVCNSTAVIKETTITRDDGTTDIVKFAYCPNKMCSAKSKGRMERFVNRNAMNIDGISGAIIEKLSSYGYLNQCDDIFKLKNYPEIKDLPGFGDRSYEKLIESIETAAKNATLVRVLYAMNIPGIGRTASKAICKLYPDPDMVMKLTVNDLTRINGIGNELATAFVDWFAQEQNVTLWKNVLQYVTLDASSESTNPTSNNLDGKTFVITGSLTHYSNRNELQAEIENLGGKVSGSVSAKTECLINNDATSTSGKNKKAKELGIRIISEDDFLHEYLGK